ncbi:MAG: FadR/GntR family transcriptional regulator [Deltaproteobacteria bacterium]
MEVNLLELDRPPSARLRANKSSLSDDLTAGILALIRAEGLQPGDRLPPVASLAQLFEVATPTLREALRRLQTAGMLTIRHGSGTYVGSQVNRRILPNPHMGEADGETVRELLEIRCLLEPTAAELAAVRVTSSDCDAAYSALAEAEKQLDDEFSLTTANMRFHMAVAQLSGNKILVETIDALLTTHTSVQHEILVLYDDRRRDFEDHQAILEAISVGDAPRARQRMLEHLNGVIEVVASRSAAI